MNSRLYIQKCAKSCRHYLEFEKKDGAICAYTDNSKVIPYSQCKYKLLTESSAKKMVSAETRLLNAIYGGGLEITLTDAKEKLKQGVKK